ncbi:MAG: Tfp pilus assembly protein FimT/FimU [Candidatus Nealsonbacteria bacterium]
MVKDKGFTLPEIIMVVSIILILTSIVIANQREGEKQFSLQRSAHKLAQDLRATQEKAMGGVRFHGAFPQQGYGVYFVENSNSYVLFADCDGDNEYDGEFLACPDCSGASCIENVYSEKVEEFFLESGVMISQLSPFSPLNITFFPPDPTITIKPESLDYQATTTLTFGGKTRTVTINTLGLIDID